MQRGSGGKLPFMTSKVLLVTAVTLATCVSAAFAQGVVAPAGDVTAPPAAEVAALPEPEKGKTIPALTPVRIEVLAALGSKTSKSLDSFAIRLAEPIEQDGVVLAPAGTMGQGEVVHAKMAGGSGAPGELVLAARYLEIEGRRMTLRSMRYANSGESKINNVNTLNTVAAATVPALSVVGFFMKGGEVDVPGGTIFEAKLAQDFEYLRQVSTQDVSIDRSGEPGDQISEESDENEER